MCMEMVLSSLLVHESTYLKKKKSFFTFLKVLWIWFPLETFGFHTHNTGELIEG